MQGAEDIARATLGWYASEGLLLLAIIDKQEVYAQGRTPPSAVFVTIRCHLALFFLVERPCEITDFYSILVCLWHFQGAGYRKNLKKTLAELIATFAQHTERQNGNFHFKGGVLP